MFIVRLFRIRDYERGLMYRRGVFERVLRPGWTVVFDPFFTVRVERVSVREPWLVSNDLDVIARSGALGDEAVVVDLADAQRAIVTIDGRVDAVLGPGLYALWTVFRDVRVDVVDANAIPIADARVPLLLRARNAASLLESVAVEPGRTGLLFVDGVFRAALAPGTYAWWQGIGRVRVVPVDLREQVLDVAGQEIMTADKVTLRLNAVVTFKVVDPLLAVTAVDDARQALYREAQLALRAAIGTRELDVLLAAKDDVAAQLDGAVRARAATFGIEVVSLGIRDIVLPGDMRDLMNRVTAAQKAAEAALITRREETAAMRSQANTARIFESNPTLMRLRELEVLEKVATNARLSVVVGDTGLTDKVIKLV